MEESTKQLPAVSKWWIWLYGFAAFWLLLVASADKSLYSPGIITVLISVLLVPLFAAVFFIDLIIRIADAVSGKTASWARRLWPVAVAGTGVLAYGGICVAFLMQL